MTQGRVAVLEDYEAPLTVQDVEVSEPGPGEIRVRVMVSGVCHTDGHVAAGDLHVVLSRLPACRACEACRKGRTGMCRRTGQAAGKGTLWDGVRCVRGKTGDLDALAGRAVSGSSSAAGGGLGAGLVGALVAVAVDGPFFGPRGATARDVASGRARVDRPRSSAPGCGPGAPAGTECPESWDPWP